MHNAGKEATQRRCAGDQGLHGHRMPQLLTAPWETTPARRDPRKSKPQEQVLRTFVNQRTKHPARFSFL